MTQILWATTLVVLSATLLPTAAHAEQECRTIQFKNENGYDQPLKLCKGEDGNWRPSSGPVGQQPAPIASPASPVSANNFETVDEFTNRAGPELLVPAPNQGTAPRRLFTEKPPAPGTIEGKWELEGTCRGKNVIVKAYVSVSSLNDPSSPYKMISVTIQHYDRATGADLAPSWSTATSFNYHANNNRYVQGSSNVVMLPERRPGSKKYASAYQYDPQFPIVFYRNGSDWTGYVDDPTCGPGRFHRPLTPSTIDASGNPTSASAWLGSSPLLKIGRSHYFDYVSKSRFLTNVELDRDARWLPAIWGVSSLSTVQCVKDSCLPSKGAKFFSVGADVLMMASRINKNEAQICTIDTSIQDLSNLPKGARITADYDNVLRWKCIHIKSELKELDDRKNNGLLWMMQAIGTYKDEYTERTDTTDTKCGYKYEREGYGPSDVRKYYSCESSGGVHSEIRAYPVFQRL